MGPRTHGEIYRTIDGGQTWAKRKAPLNYHEAIFKLLYLTLRNIAKKWTMSVHDWKAALNRFASVYENRLAQDAQRKLTR